MVAIVEYAKEFACIICSQKSVVTSILLFLSFLLVWTWKKVKSESSRQCLNANTRSVPGPTGIPILGYLPFLGPRLFVATQRLQKKYGDIFVVPIGMQKFVFLNSYDSIREAFVDQADRFSGRFQFEMVMNSCRRSGIAFTNGPVWLEHRRFALRMMKDFGLGRSHSEEIILREAEVLRDQLEAESGSPQDTKTIFCSSVSNMISIIAFGDRSGHEDPEFGELMHRVDTIVKAGGFATVLPIIFPFVNRHQWIYKPVEWLLRLDEHNEWCHDFIRRKIEEHRKQILGGDPSLTSDTGLGEAHDFCDALLLEQMRCDAAGKQHTFKEWQLIRNLYELFIAGTDTTAVTLCWAWVLLSLHPNVQEGVHEELDKVVGRQRQPRMADKKSCHFISAVLDEVLRMSTIAPFALPHRSTEDAVVQGIFIPKNNVIMPNLYAVHHDPKLWDEPHEFRPSRFLNPDDGSYRPAEHLIVFGLGKRACLGESLARMELFLFFTVLMQRLSVRLEEPHPSREELLLGEDGTARHLCKHRIIFDTRKTVEDN